MKLTTLGTAALWSSLVVTVEPALADLQGRVVAVTDGDTVEVLAETNTQHRVRLTGIDAP